MGEQPTRQQATNDANTAWSIISLLMAGILVWGGIGWAIDHFAGTSFVFPVGMLIGAGSAMYLVVRRYGLRGETTHQDSTEKTE